MEGKPYQNLFHQDLDLAFLYHTPFQRRYSLGFA
jgi:hypothetical protein